MLTADVFQFFIKKKNEVSSFSFFFARYLGLKYFYIVGLIWVLRDPTFPAKNKTKQKQNIRKRLGRGTLNACAKFQGPFLQNGVDIWTFVR